MPTPMWRKPDGGDGKRWWEIDMTWWAIWLLKALGLAQKAVMPPVKPISER